MNTNPAVVFDACVLYPAPLRDLLLELAGRAQDKAWFRAKWTEEIHSEWIRNLLIERTDLTLAQLERTKELMNRHIDDCVVDGYAHRIAGLKLPDEQDRHVLAAAIECGASIIVTANISDFPAEIVSENGVVVMTADDFIVEVTLTFEEDGESALDAAVRAIIQRLRNPPMTWEQYFHCLATMQGNELLKTVALLREIIPAHELASEG
jgi:predicted nucleic acid-binding protein